MFSYSSPHRLRHSPTATQFGMKTNSHRRPQYSLKDRLYIFPILTIHMYSLWKIIWGDLQANLAYKQSNSWQ